MFLDVAAFEQVIEIVLHHEGGYVNNPADPGGETNFGISKRQYPDVDIAHLTREQAVELYRKDYWNKIKADQLPAGIRLLMMDTAVNMGPGRAIKFLQQALHLPQDGLLGPITLSAANRANPKDLLLVLAKLRHDFYAQDKNWQTFGKGWTRRLLEVSLYQASSTTHQNRT